MSKIEAKIIADSKNEFSNRITTMQVTFPRFILAELNTHRMMSRNSASSRAIPFEKMLKSVEENPFIPIAWQKDHKGMQGTEYLTNDGDILSAKSKWLMSRDNAIQLSRELSNNRVTKQLCNRLLEPFMWHTVLITATEWENFFALRCPKYEFEGEIARSWKDYLKINDNIDNDFSVLERLQCNKGQAEIHMMALAEAMWDAYNESTPKELKAGEWHIPFGDNIDEKLLCETIAKNRNLNPVFVSANTPAYDSNLKKIATARCARVSYTVVGEEGKEANYENDLKLHDRLAESGHWSPFEHCAQAMNVLYSSDMNTEWSGNFKGFIQYRKQFISENIQ